MSQSNSKNIPHPAAPAADELYDGNIVTKKNWVDFATYRYRDCSEFLSYIDGIEHMTSHLKNIIDNYDRQSLGEFKQQIIEFCDDQRDFVQHIKTMPSPGDVWD